MESVTRWIFIALAGVLAWIYIPKLLSVAARTRAQPIGVGPTEIGRSTKFARRAQQKCEIAGQALHRASSRARGAALVDYFLTGDRSVHRERASPSS